MKTAISKSVIVLILTLSAAALLWANEHIDSDKMRWKQFYLEEAPADTTRAWLVPFKTSNRSKLNTLKVVSTFGSHRNSYIKGHKHTGLDCVPKAKRDTVDVYPMAPGIVCSIHLGAPHQTIVIRHITSVGKTIYTSYKHLGAVYVKTGDQVTVDTKLARLYTRAEARALGGAYDHLHLEIRKKFDDYGCASWCTMTKAELRLRFYDPLAFMREHLKD